MKNLKTILLLFAVCFAVMLQAQDIIPYTEEYYPEFQKDNIENASIRIKPIEMNVALYDSLFAQWQKDNLFDSFVSFDQDQTTDFKASESDSLYKARLDNLFSPIILPYNKILKQFIVSYTTTKKAVVSSAVRRAQYFFPIIEAELEANDLPLELRMMPVVESLLRPTAVSRMGATGIWQFMYATGKMYKLDITSFLDERRDPVASTRAACKFLKDLYNIYGDWSLALAAYNCGPGNVNKAIRRAGGEVEGFWDIYYYLPRETRAYVPLIVAANYACNYHAHHNILPSKENIFLHTDTVTINKLTHLEQISSTIDMPLEMLRTLNPQYKKDIIPAVEKSYPLVLPQSYIMTYLDNEKAIMAKDTMYLEKYIKAPSLAKMEMMAATVVHRVKSGDTLGGIANKYHVSITNLLRWNNLKRNSILRIGQRIEIHR